MRYYKIIETGYIQAIGTGGGGTEITEAEYSQIMSAIQQKPERNETTDFRLKENLTWEEYERPMEPETDEIDAEEALGILLGGEAE